MNKMGAKGDYQFRLRVIADFKNVEESYKIEH